ncbi:MAG: hypothetical protein BWY69_00987 [Planctomycetes bacterium ADurb.Bin401]|nr:MAG: hypothetical protein BWY69_00987 [Planctomycetes bacterium ADurb.Bin401]
MDTGNINESRSGGLGQNQIIAKTLLIVCGIYISLTIVMKNMSLVQTSFQRDFGGFFTGMFSAIVFIGTLFAILYFFVLNNDWLVGKILPSEEPIEPEKQQLWLGASLRVGLVFLGLVLLAKETQSVIFTAGFILKLPMLGRELISNIVRGDKWFEDRLLARHIYNLIATGVIVYLIAGGPGFVKWELRHKFTRKI